LVRASTGVTGLWSSEESEQAGDRQRQLTQLEEAHPGRGAPAADLDGGAQADRPAGDQGPEQEVDDEERAQELLKEPGVRGLIGKPFSMNRLMDKARECVPGLESLQ
jgi:hypothetical protein